MDDTRYHGAGGLQHDGAMEGSETSSLDPSLERLQSLKLPITQKKPKRFYKPWIMTWPSLFVLVLTTCALLAIVELAVERLPNFTSRGSMARSNDAVQRRGVYEMTKPYHIKNPRELVYGRQVDNTTSIGTTSRPNVVYSPAHSNFLGTSTTGHSVYLETTIPTVINTPPATNSPSPTDTASVPTDTSSKPGETTVIATVPGTAGGTTTRPAVVPLTTSNSNAWLTTEVVTLSAPHSSLLSLNPASVTGVPALVDSSNSSYPDLSMYSLSRGTYFIGTFLPTVVAVLFAIPFRVLDLSIRSMEPFFRLYGSGWVTGAQLVDIDYSQSNIFVVLWKSAANRHGVVFLSSFISLLFLVIVPLSAEAIYLHSGNCIKTSDAMYCISSVSTSVSVARWLEALLGLVALLTALLAFLIVRRESGVFANPTSICAAGTLLNRTPLEWLWDNHSAESDEPERLLKGTIFRLGVVDSSGEWGVVMSVNPGRLKSDKDSFVSASSSVQNGMPRKNRKKLIFNAVLAVLAACTAITLFVMVVVYYNESRSTAFERFMDSQSFGSKFLLVFLAVLTKAFWEKALSESSSREVYHRLSTTQATARETILVPVDSSAFISFFKSIHRKHFFVAYVAMMALLGEALTVAVSNLPFRQGLTLETFKISAYISMSILGLMLIAFVLVAFKRQSHIMGSEVPTSFAGFLLLVARSHWREDLEGLSMLRTRERDRRIEAMQRRYVVEPRFVNGSVWPTVEYGE